MLRRAELKLVYATLVVLAEVRWNTKAMESRLAQDAEEMKSLELCTNSNTQRLGSVFGNFTRHHKKGHRRRTTSTTPPTTSTVTSTSTSIIDEDDFVTSHYSTIPPLLELDASYPKLPQPLRLSLDIDTDVQRYTDNIDDSVNKGNSHDGVRKNTARVDKIGNVREFGDVRDNSEDSIKTIDDFVDERENLDDTRQRIDYFEELRGLRDDANYNTDVEENTMDGKVNTNDRLENKEILPELSETSLSKSMTKVKKMYRESSASVANRVAKNGKAGIFITDNCTTVVAQIGTTAILHCEVSDITENTVTWIRRKDYSLLSVGLVTYSADSRFFSAHGRHVKDWALHIRFVTSADSGYYECQVPTHPPTSIFFKLVLVAAFADIAGEAEKIIHEGSMLRLVCVVRKSTEPPSYVFWYFENRMINYDLNGVSVSNGRQTSELVISRAQPRHAGNYTCVPANARPASVTVHVIQSETPAAMQHGNNSEGSNRHCEKWTVLLATVIVSIIKQIHTRVNN